MTDYPEDQKQQLIEQMLAPHNRPIPQIHRETGIPKGTLYGWCRQAQRTMVQTPCSAPKAQDPSRRWSGAQKFAMVVETMMLSETDRAAYCRKRGIYPEQLHAWKQACEQANREDRGRTQGSGDAQAERRRTKDLERELRRKEKALAEAAALLVLQKKARAIWGTDEDD